VLRAWGDEKCAQNLRKSERKRLAGRHAIILTWILQLVTKVSRLWIGFIWLRIKTGAGCYEPSASMKSREFLIICG
jgi:hypothetical protein